jgi:hypothetical protein
VIVSRQNLVRVILPILCLALISPGLLAQEAQELNSEVQSELQRKWSAVILPMAAGEGEPLRSAPVVRSLAQIIREHLSHIDSRFLIGEELSVVENRIRDLGYRGEVPIPVNRQLEISIAEGGSGTLIAMFHRQLRQVLAGEGAFDPELVAELSVEFNADLFIAGYISVQDSYLFIELLVVSPAHLSEGGDGLLHRQLFSIRSIEALDRIGPFVSGELGGALYNGPHGSISLGWTPEDDSFRIYLDGEYRGNRPVTLRVVPAGEHLIELYQGTRLRLSRVVSLDAGEDREIRFEPEPPEGDSIMISTIPQGLALYGNSSFLGFTPLVMDAPESDQYLQVSGPGIRPAYLGIGPDSPMFLRIEMPDGSIDWRQRMEQDRRSLYRSLGFTLISAFVPLIAEGVYRNAASVPMGSLSAAESNRLLVKAKISRTVSIGGLWITLLSAADTVERLLIYLDTAETARGVLPTPRE